LPIFFRVFSVLGPYINHERGATVVVIPFANLSGNPADNWLGAGFAETVSVDLKNQQGDFIDFGETLAERFLVTNRLQRTNRAFFTKFLYLFRY